MEHDLFVDKPSIGGRIQQRGGLRDLPRKLDDHLQLGAGEDLHIPGVDAVDAGPSGHGDVGDREQGPPQGVREFLGREHRIQADGGDQRQQHVGQIHQQPAIDRLLDIHLRHPQTGTLLQHRQHLRRDRATCLLQVDQREQRVFQLGIDVFDFLGCVQRCDPPERRQHEHHDAPCRQTEQQQQQQRHPGAKAEPSLDHPVIKQGKCQQIGENAAGGTDRCRQQIGRLDAVSRFPQLVIDELPVIDIPGRLRRRGGGDRHVSVTSRQRWGDTDACPSAGYSIRRPRRSTRSRTEPPGKDYRESGSLPLPCPDRSAL
jgi:hypothetical protein